MPKISKAHKVLITKSAQILGQDAIQVEVIKFPLGSCKTYLYWSARWNLDRTQAKGSDLQNIVNTSSFPRIGRKDLLTDSKSSYL